MRVITLNYSDVIGGAARAAYRIHRALLRHGVDSCMQVNRSVIDDHTIQAPEAKAFSMLRGRLGLLLPKVLKTNNNVLHSPGIFPSGWPRRLNESDADVLNLHWVNSEMMSIADIGRLQKPIVWTLHDMWAFCGAEHYTADFRWRDGYTSLNRPAYESGFDLNRWVWQCKKYSWRNPMHIVTPSNWLANCVAESYLMREMPVTVIPNPIDTDVWKPLDKLLARQLFDLPSDTPLLLFGALGGAVEPRKGFDLLKAALNLLRGQVDGLELVVFGQLPPKIKVDMGFPVHYLGHLHDDLTLRVLYSAADVMVVPSRQEAFGQTASEALACGTPVVAFGSTGLVDVVKHMQTGYLATSFEVDDLAKGIQWVLSDKQRYERLSTYSREDAVARFSYPIIAEKYIQVYKATLAAANANTRR